MKKLLLIPPFLIASCLACGLYGALHNQVSYTVSPDYFHAFKFIQFRIDPDLQNRLGASLVGWMASWWMGLILGLPLTLIALIVKGVPGSITAFRKAIKTVLLVTLAIGLVALAFASLTFHEDNSFEIIELFQLSGLSLDDPTAFARAGFLHNATYLGALVGLVVALIGLAMRAVKSRKTAPTQIKTG